MAARRASTPAGPLAALPDPPPVSRRRAERIDAAIRVIVRGASGIPQRARTTDISDHGLALKLRRRVEVGQRIALDLECELPLRVHLGYAADLLVIDGPMRTHVVRVEGRVVRAERRADRSWHVGLEICPDTPFDERQIVQMYVDHLRDDESWAI